MALLDEVVSAALAPAGNYPVCIWLYASAPAALKGANDAPNTNVLMLGPPGLDTSVLDAPIGGVFHTTVKKTTLPSGFVVSVY